jgi:23S rRNA (uracil1939-C5)-methyltransferase
MRPTSTNSINERELIELTIEHIDPLGQGVAKIPQPDDRPSEIYFIPKTLPGEVITAEVEQKSRNLNFSKLKSIKTPSPLRIEAECQHFDVCGGCHFLHSPHQNEWDFKLEALKDQFKRHLKWDIAPKLEEFRSENRFQYRNRIQLHYQLSPKPVLGFRSGSGREIVQVPHCKLPVRALQDQVQALYQDDNWVKLMPKPHKPEGHLEIEWLHKAGRHEMAIRWNQPYAHDGFSQVNEVMNQTLKKFLLKTLEEMRSKNTQSSGIVLDLFCGDGNLTKHLPKPFIVVGADSFVPQGPHALPHYLQLDLFNPEALGRFKVNFAGLKIPKENPLVMIVDPPRSGFQNMKNWTSVLKPKFLVAVSCNYATLIRDLKSMEISEEQCLKVAAFDMFPGTFHLECCAIIAL